MEKIAHDKVAQVLRQTGTALRALSEENQALKEKVAFFEKKERVEKLAGVMQAKNLDPDSSYSEKVDRLMKTDDLAVVEKAVDLSAPQIKLAAISDDPGNPSDAASAFEAAILE